MTLGPTRVGRPETSHVIGAPLRLGWRAGRRWVLASILIASIAVVMRLSVTPMQWAMFAEDGTVFLGEAWQGGGAPWDPYAGYLHVLPRLVALGVAPFPIALAAALTTFAAAAAAATCAYFCVNRLRSVLIRTWSRCVFAVFMVASPAAMGEVLGNLANLHWVLTASAVIALWMPVRLPRSGWRDYSGAAVCLLAALSDPLTALALVPVGFLAARSLFTRTSTRLVLERVALPLIALLVGLTAQLAAALADPRPIGGMPGAADLAQLYLAYSGPRTLLGSPLASAAAIVTAELLVFVGALAVVVIVWLASFFVLPHSGFPSLFVVAALPALASLSLNWNPELLDVRFPHGTARYAYIGATLTMLPALALAQQSARPFWRAAGLCCVGVMALGMVANLVYGRYLAPAWDEALETAASACLVADVALVPIAPEGWVAPVPCDRLAPDDDG